MGDRVLIVGASGRAAAASALRAGFDPFVIDLFADADTKRLCPILKCDPNDYPHGFIELAKLAPPGPWMYTGGLENHPDVVAAISETRRLWGHEPAQFANVRDPFRLFSILHVRGYQCPRVCTFATHPSGGRWLVKKFNSGGGRGITEYDKSVSPPAEMSVLDQFGIPHVTNGYVQEYVPGIAVSALYLSKPWKVDLLGLSIQLVGTPWLHAKRFEYAGNIAPCPPTDDEWEILERLGWLFNQCGLKCGLFGLDVIRTDGQPVPIEVNPRYTASVELYEHACTVSVLAEHADCSKWGGSTTDTREHWESVTELTSTKVVGKGIYYAAKAIPFPASGPWDESLARCTDVWRRPDYADIPEPGTQIEFGQPVLTILAEATTEADCVEQLKRRAAELDQLFGVPTPTEGEP